MVCYFDLILDRFYKHKLLYSIFGLVFHHFSILFHRFIVFCVGLKNSFFLCRLHCPVEFFFVWRFRIFVVHLSSYLKQVNVFDLILHEYLFYLCSLDNLTFFSSFFGISCSLFHNWTMCMSTILWGCHVRAWDVVRKVFADLWNFLRFVCGFHIDWDVAFFFGCHYWKSIVDHWSHYFFFVYYRSVVEVQYFSFGIYVVFCVLFWFYSALLCCCWYLLRFHLLGWCWNWSVFSGLFNIWHWI